MSLYTIIKKDKTVLDAQILIASNSVDETRQENNAQVVAQAFRIVDEDNELISKRVKLKEKESIHIEDYKFKRVGENTFSVDEMQNYTTAGKNFNANSWDKTYGCK
ncbi:hypothetical protein [Clostridium tagluense]|uniref:hypothetical protein n=1 Tax=Clostridium tagluense TaxID=360422 RepID=UPI001CF56AB5|nr:hypothetical protein [Clostridium tagluense]MCB2300113.1 hypothetical protein [Clostridium tagluense]